MASSVGEITLRAVNSAYILSPMYERVHWTQNVRASPPYIKHGVQTSFRLLRSISVSTELYRVRGCVRRNI